MTENVNSPASPPCGDQINFAAPTSPQAPSHLNGGLGAGPSHHHLGSVPEPYTYSFISGRVPTFEFNDPIALNLIKEQVRKSFRRNFLKIFATIHLTYLFLRRYLSYSEEQI